MQTIKRVFWGGIKFGFLFALLGAIALGVMVWRARAEMPDFDSLKTSSNAQMIRVRARDGQMIQSLGPSFGRWIAHDDIPLVMRDAMIAVEDRRYYSHIGVDPLGIARSVQVRIQRGHWAQGGSTITQQLARNIFLNNSRTFSRKLREGVLALALETKYSKDEILELYLNKVYFGGGAYGIDSASRKFFDHSADQLTLAEAAIIAGFGQGAFTIRPDGGCGGGDWPRGRCHRHNATRGQNHRERGGGGGSGKSETGPRSIGDGGELFP